MRARGRVRGRALDAGIGLVELLVAIVLVTIALLGMAGEIAANLTQQTLENSQATALHIADEWLEQAQVDARTNAGFQTIATLVSSTQGNPTVTVKNIPYTREVSVQTCANGSPPPNCTTGGADYTKISQFATIKVSWQLTTKTHSITLVRNLTANDEAQDIGVNESPLSNCPTKAQPGATAVRGTLALTPTNAATNTGRMNENTSWHPWGDGTSDAPGYVTATLTNVSGLLWPDPLHPTAGDESLKTTCIQLEFYDDRGPHYVAMHAANGDGTTLPTTWTASVPAVAITRALPYPSTDYYHGCVPFRALLPMQSLPTTLSCGHNDGGTTGEGTLYTRLQPPSFGTCTVNTGVASIGITSLVTQLGVLSQANTLLKSLLGGLLGPLLGALNQTQLTTLINAVTSIQGTGIAVTNGQVILGNNILAPGVLPSIFQCSVNNMGLAAPGDSVTVKITPNCSGGTNFTTMSVPIVSGQTPTTAATTWRLTKAAPWTSCADPKPPTVTLNPGDVGHCSASVLGICVTSVVDALTLTGGTPVTVTYSLTRADTLTATSASLSVYVI